MGDNQRYCCDVELFPLHPEMSRKHNRRINNLITKLLRSARKRLPSDAVTSCFPTRFTLSSPQLFLSPIPTSMHIVCNKTLNRSLPYILSPLIIKNKMLTRLYISNRFPAPGNLISNMMQRSEPKNYWPATLGSHS